MKFSKIMILTAVATMALSAGACTKKEQAAAEGTTVAAAANMEQAPDVKIPASDSQFRPGMKVEKPTLVDFNAVWCPPCRMLTPAYDLAAAEFAKKVDFYSINVDSFPETAQAFQLKGIPTLVLFMPDGSMQVHEGLDDFVEGLDPESNPTQAEITNTLFANLKKMLNEAVK